MPWPGSSYTQPPVVLSSELSSDVVRNLREVRLKGIDGVRRRIERCIEGVCYGFKVLLVRLVYGFKRFLALLDLRVGVELQDLLKVEHAIVGILLEQVFEGAVTVGGVLLESGVELVGYVVGVVFGLLLRAVGLAARERLKVRLRLREVRSPHARSCGV